MTAPLPEADLFSLRDRVVVVTGASGGLGERFARVAHGAGAHVVGAARRVERLQALESQLPGFRGVQTDVTDSGSLARLVDATVGEFGRIDVLVNNAGGGQAMPALDVPLGDFIAVVQLNLVALFELSRLVARHMVDARQGAIVNIASMLGSVSAWPTPSTPYAAAKGAVVNLTRELACQWAASGVRVNAIAPGFFGSESMDPLAAGDGFAKYVHRQCPMGRIGAPHELDGALLFLASDASSYVTGQVLTVDGGWTAH
jgi:NAD(P)-dependent dehydrogenase (short-subunit alcohol dehydrogenase family)